LVNGQDITKIILYICSTAVIIFSVKSCELTAEVIEECQRACSDLGNRLVEVSIHNCECTGGTMTGTQTTDDIWVIPRK
jgi:hypothetical protein